LGTSWYGFRSEDRNRYVLLAKTGVNRDLKKGTYFGPIAEEFKIISEKKLNSKI
jgi:hypothetical protein